MLEKPLSDIFYNSDYKDENQIEIKEIKEKDENEIQKDEIIIDNKQNELNIIKDFAIDMVSESQKFIRNNTDVSSVSLREIMRGTPARVPCSLALS